MYLETTNIV
jgi:hypothetical protein